MSIFDNVEFWYQALIITGKTYYDEKYNDAERYFIFRVDGVEHVLTCASDQRRSIKTGAVLDLLSRSSDSTPSFRECDFAINGYFFFECSFVYDNIATQAFGVSPRLDAFYKSELTKFTDDSELEHLLMIMRLEMGR